MNDCLNVCTSLPKVREYLTTPLQHNATTKNIKNSPFCSRQASLTINNK